MKDIKIVIVGAGSTYTPELVEGLIKRKDSLKVSEVVLMDIDAEKLEIVGGLAERMIRAAGLGWIVSFSSDLSCIGGADYVMTQMRVGRLPARILDEKIPLKHGLIGQETCGIGGFFKAMRTIPVLFEIADVIKRTAPNAVMINFTNPSGIVAEALKRKDIRSIGLCNGPFYMEKSVKEKIGIEGLETEYVGLNHLAWITAARCGGKDYLKDALESGIESAAMKNIPATGFGIELLKTVKAIPSSYLEYYYFKHEKLASLKAESLSRGEVCQQLETALLMKYRDPSLTIKPPELEKRGGAHYSEVAVNLVDAIHNDKKNRHIINIRNNGTLDFLDKDDIIETPAMVGKKTEKPIKIKGFSNPHVIAAMRTMKDYEKMAVEAIISGSKESMIRALMQNPLCDDYRAVKACFEAHGNAMNSIKGISL